MCQFLFFKGTSRSAGNADYFLGQVDTLIPRMLINAVDLDIHSTRSCERVDN